MTKIIEEMTKLFFQNNIPVFGTTSTKSLGNEPSGYRPSDMLASAKSILCLGLPVPKGIFKCQGKIRMDVLEGCKYLLSLHRRNSDAGCTHH